MKFDQVISDVHAKLDRSSCEVGPIMRSWPKVLAKLAQSSCEVGPKFLRSWPKVLAKLAQSTCAVGPKFMRSSLQNVNTLFARIVRQSGHNVAYHPTVVYRLQYIRRCSHYSENGGDGNSHFHGDVT